MFDGVFSDLSLDFICDFFFQRCLQVFLRRITIVLFWIFQRDISGITVKILSEGPADGPGFWMILGIFVDFSKGLLLENLLELPTPCGKFYEKFLENLFKRSQEKIRINLESDFFFVKSGQIGKKSESNPGTKYYSNSRRKSLQHLWTSLTTEHNWRAQAKKPSITNVCKASEVVASAAKLSCSKRLNLPQTPQNSLKTFWISVERLRFSWNFI